MMGNRDQMSLPIPEPVPTVAASKPCPPADHIQPIKSDGSCMELLKVRYSLKPVEGWVEVRDLAIYQPCGGGAVHQRVAEQAWLDPATVTRILIQRYGDIAPRGAPPIAPASWGFGPRHQVGRHDYAMASFDLAHPVEDYKRVAEAARARRDEMFERLGPEPLHGYYEVPA